MTAPTQPPTDDRPMSEPVKPEIKRFEVQVRPQPNVTLYNGADQTPFAIVHKVTGERMEFGKRLGERTFDDVLMVLTCDQDRGMWWILVVDMATGSMWQNGYLIEHASEAFEAFVGLPASDVREHLMVDSPSN